MAVDPQEPTYRVVQLPNTVHRVARKGAGDRYATITPADDSDPRAGNRFDVLGGGVLYVASEPITCYFETLAPLRPAPGITLKAAKDDAAFLAPGNVPAQWREDRLLYSLSPVMRPPLPFVDLSDVETRTWLYRLLESELAPLGVDHLDVPEVTHPDRVLSRRLARLLYSVTDDDGMPVFGGIRYSSRYNQGEAWAVFDRCAVEITDQQRIDKRDNEVSAVARAFGLTLH